MTTYESPGCAYYPSTVRACRKGESDERGPGFCPSKMDAEGIAQADDYLEPPVTALALMGYKRAEKIADVGYRYAVHEIQSWNLAHHRRP